MAEGPGLETYTGYTSSLNGSQAHDAAGDAVGTGSSRGLYIFLGLALAAAGLTFTIVRLVLRRRPADPTTERIQQLIDEANRLLKQLDEKQPAP